jgi:acyl transferase domain-containing protein
MAKWVWAEEVGMSRGGAAVVFPGQGSLQRSAVDAGALRSAFLDVTSEMGLTSEMLKALRNRSLATSGQVSLFVLAASVAHYRVLRGEGLAPAVLLGHGFGELSALVCAGALTLKQAAGIVGHRTAALEGSRAIGSMMVARTSKRAAGRLLDVVGRETIGIAAENGPVEVVISGAPPAMAAFEVLARSRGIALERLAAPWPLHCRPLMFRAAAQFTERLVPLTSQPIQTPVFSPILGRHYRDSDNLGECLGLHLTLPVRFSGAVRHLSSSEGLRTFLVCGPLTGLDRAVQEITRPANPSRAAFHDWYAHDMEERSGDLAVLAS